MLQENITNFLEYCKNTDYPKRSIGTLSFRLNEFDKFLQESSISSIENIDYQLLLKFVADLGNPSPSVKKARVWAMHQFFRYLKLKQLIKDNIALKLPYPKIEKKVAQFLTEDEFKLILKHFTQKATDLRGLRNLIMIMILGFLGLRTIAVVAIDVSDVDLTESRLWIKEKGYQGKTKKSLPIPQLLCQIIAEYIKQLDKQQVPLFISKLNKRYSNRSLQQLFKNGADQLGIEKRLHSHLFRHTAATQLNKIAGLKITQFVLAQLPLFKKVHTDIIEVKLRKMIRHYTT